MKIILCIVFLVNYVYDLSSQPTKYAFIEGQEILINQTFDIGIDQDYLGVAMQMNTKVTNSILLKTATVKEDLAMFEVSYSYVSMDFEIGMGEDAEVQKMHVNSDSEPTISKFNETHALLKSLKNEPFYVYMKSDGTVQKIDGIETLAHKMRSAATDSLTLKELEKSFGQEKLKTDFARFFVPYPSVVLADGTTWATTITIPELELYDSDQLWTVNNMNLSKNQIEISALVPSIKLEKVENNVSMILDGDLNTYYVVDAMTGWPQQIEMMSIMQGEAEMFDVNEEKWPVSMKFSSVVSFAYEQP